MNLDRESSPAESLVDLKEMLALSKKALARDQGQRSM